MTLLTPPQPDSSVKETLPRGPSLGAGPSLAPPDHWCTRPSITRPWPHPLCLSRGPWVRRAQPSPYFRLESSMTRPRTVSVASSMLAASQLLISTRVLAGREAGREA